jgi:NTE family protein
MSGIFNRLRKRKPTGVGLALGSGAARGWAHIGAIRAIREADIEIDYVAGTSIGALVGAAFASGHLDALERLVKELDWKGAMSLLDIGLPRSGLIDGKKVTASLRKHVDPGNMEDLDIPFRAVATNLVDGSEVVIDEGDLVDAIRASISIAGMFTPVRKGDMLLVDGGILNPVPAGVVRDMGAQYVIAVDVHQKRVDMEAFAFEDTDSKEDRESPEARANTEDSGESGPSGILERLETVGEKLATRGLTGVSNIKDWLSMDEGPNIFEVVLTAIDIMEAQIAEMQLENYRPDLTIKPQVSDIRPIDFHRGQEAIEKGHRAAMEALRSSGLLKR